MDILGKVGFCAFCHKLMGKSKIYQIYRIKFNTNKDTYTVGILSINEELSNWLFSRGSHLSYSQIILLRPDLVLDFLKAKFNSPKETVSAWWLESAEICKNCYDNQYAVQVPER